MRIVGYIEHVPIEELHTASPGGFEALEVYQRLPSKFRELDGREDDPGPLTIRLFKKNSTLQLRFTLEEKGLIIQKFICNEPAGEKVVVPAEKVYFK